MSREFRQQISLREKDFKTQGVSKESIEIFYSFFYSFNRKLYAKKNRFKSTFLLMHKTFIVSFNLRMSCEAFQINVKNELTNVTKVTCVAFFMHRIECDIHKPPAHSKKFLVTPKLPTKAPAATVFT